MEYRDEEEGGKTKVYVLTHDDSTYSSIKELVTSHRDEGSNIWLHECLPPSEFGMEYLFM